MQVPVLIAFIASLLVLVSLVQPLAARLRLPPSVLLAMVGILIGSPAYLIAADIMGMDRLFASDLTDLAIPSSVFLYVFLPTLLFETALTVDVRRMAEDTVPILVLAVLAVVIATIAIGVAIAPVSGQPLVVCLLLGAIVATTDPVAVVSVFRDIGAPARLGRLVEGESLLNDAAAITLFTLFLALLVSGTPVDTLAAAGNFLISFTGGMLIGYAGAQLAGLLLDLTRRFRHAQVTLSLALPYLVFVASEQGLHVSGVVAVVAAGLTLNLIGASRTTPDNWHYLKSVWEQVAFWASSLIFILASLLIPNMLSGLGFDDLRNLAVLLLAATAARALVLFAIMPLLSAARLAAPVERTYKTVILWGGLRGAVTLALALAVTENGLIEAEAQRFVAVLATGFVLFSLLVQGTTLRPLIRLLGLDRLSPLDQALRGQVVAVALQEVRDAVGRAAASYRIAPDVAEDVASGLKERIARATQPGSAAAPIRESDRVALGLVSLTGREQQIVLEHLGARTISPRLAETLIAHGGRLLDGVRGGGVFGYRRAARRALRFSWRTRSAQILHRRLGLSRFLEERLTRRFEALMASRIMLGELAPFVKDRIAPLLGPRIGEILDAILAERRELVSAALQALRLQYPDYADALELRFLRRTALRREEMQYQALFDEGLIGTELLKDLTAQVEAARAEAERRPRLDLGFETRELVAQLPLFASLTDEELDAVSRLLKPRFALPGEKLIRRGGRGDAAYFISSGAVEVSAATGKVRLGRGDFFGELALLTGAPRTADVTAIAYCQLLVLFRDDFRHLLAEHPAIREHVERIAESRQAAPAEPAPREERLAG